jgi:hypothetical protein
MHTRPSAIKLMPAIFLEMSAMKYKFCTAFAESVHVFCVSLTLTVEPAAQTFHIFANQCPVRKWCTRNFHLNLRPWVF